MMPIIRNDHDLRSAYSWLRLLTCTRDSAGKPEVIDDQQVVCYDTISGDVYDQMSLDAWLEATRAALTD